MAPFVPEAMAADPYPMYAAMRNGSRKLALGPFELWMLSRYEEVASAFKRPELFSSIAFRESRPDTAFAHLPKEKLRELRAVMLPEIPSVINSDPPTTAWARTWRGSRAGSRSKRSSRASRTCGSPGRSSAIRIRSCAGRQACPWRSSPRARSRARTFRAEP
jgi:hypothetical protein